MYKLYMEFENPTEAMFGKRRSVQGMAIHGDTAFVLYHSGVAGAYDLVSRDPKPIGVFKLGSYCKNEEDKRYDNHANDAMFGATMPDEEFPLMYVTAGNSGDADEKGWLAFCAVEQIRLKAAFIPLKLFKKFTTNLPKRTEQGLRFPVGDGPLRSLT